MSKINDLIKKLCSNGVKFYKLSDIGDHFSGLAGKSKKDFVNGNCKYITYTNIYNNPSTNLEAKDYVQVKETEKQNEIKYKDILIAGSSENLEDSGMISVVTKTPNEKIYLNSFCFGFRLNDVFYEKYNPNFLKHLFRDKNFRNEIISCSFGVTRYNLSKEKFLKIKIPCPPLEVQEKIAQILDKFGELEMELEEKLEAELEARKSQYEFWHDNLFRLENAKEYKFKDLAKLITKQTGFDYTNHIKATLINAKNDNTIPYIQTKFFTGKSFDYNTDYYIPKDVAYRFNKILLNEKCILLSIVGASIGNVGLFDGTVESFLGGAIGMIKLSDDINIEYIYHYLQSPYGQNQIKNNIKGSGQASLTIESIREFIIPIPSVEEQNKIVQILNKFDRLINDFTVRIHAEIELRKKQYEYYRNKLLSFEELKNE